MLSQFSNISCYEEFDMENLEEQIINRLNKVLNKYNLEIICKNKHNYKTVISLDATLKKYCNKYTLVEIDDDGMIVACYYAWDKIEFMLLSSTNEYSIFDSIDAAHEIVKQYNDIGLNPYKNYMLLDKLFNKLYSLNNCFCLEELAIKMDLMGIQCELYAKLKTQHLSYILFCK